MFERQFYDDVVVVTVNRICLRQYPVQKVTPRAMDLNATISLTTKPGIEK